MARFRDFFRRGKQQVVECQEVPSHTTPKTNAKHFEHNPTLPSTTDIASLPVAGMQRSNHGTYMTTYNSTRAPLPSSRDSSDTSTVSDSSRTAVDNTFISQNGDSVWKGKPTGKPYDKREELTEEDEDMWAKLAM